MAQDAAQHVHHDAFRDFSFATRRKPQHLHYLPFKTLLTRSATDNYQAWLEHLYPFAPGEDYPFPEGQTQEEQILTFKRLKDQVLRWGASDPNFKNGRVAQWVQEAWERLKKAAEDGSDLMLLEVIGTYPTPPAPDWGVQETALDINTKTINHRAESDIARRALLYKLFTERPYTLKGGGPPKFIEPLVMRLVKAWEDHLGICAPPFITIDERIHHVLLKLTAIGPIVPGYIFNGSASDKWGYLVGRAEELGLIQPYDNAVPSVAEGENRQQSATLSPTEEVEECPFDLDELTTSEQKKRVLFVWKNRPTPSQIRSKFKLNRSAWGKFKDSVNSRLTTCQLRFNKNDFRYELVGIKDQ